MPAELAKWESSLKHYAEFEARAATWMKKEDRLAANGLSYVTVFNPRDFSGSIIICWLIAVSNT
jgi:hypothetical protein